MKKISILLVLFGLTACASVFRGTEQVITFQSEPSGAEILVDGNSLGVTPLTTKLKKNKYDVVMIKMSGYKTMTKPLDKSYDGIALLNIFWDSSTTDLITGAAYEYTPNSHFFKLEKDQVDSQVK